MFSADRALATISPLAMDPPENSPRELPAGSPDDGKQLVVVFELAKSMVDEEFRRSERLDAKSRNQFTSVGALFAVVMVTTAGVLNALLDQDKVDAWVYPTLGGCALASIFFLLVALAWSANAWRLQELAALSHNTLITYISFAERGNVAVTKQLIQSYADILANRRERNAESADNLEKASVVCVIAACFSLLQLGAVFVALITR